MRPNVGRQLKGTSIHRFVDRISNLGSNHTDDRLEQNQARVINRLGACAIFSALTVTMIVCFIEASLEQVIVLSCITPVMGIPLILNRQGRLSLAKKIHLIIYNLMVFCLSILFGEDAQYQCFFFVMVGLPHILFLNSTAKTKWTFTFIPIVLWILAEISFSRIEPFVMLSESRKEYFQFTFNSLQFIFTAIMFHFFATESEKYMGELKVEQKNLESSNAKLDEALETANSATRAKSMFLANMSHEIRTPLNGIIMSSELMKNSELTHQQKELNGIVLKSGESLLTIVNNILDLSKAEANKLELHDSTFDLHQLIHSTTHSFKFVLKDKGLQLNTTVASQVQQFYLGDEQKLRQVLTNLISNSIKFCEDGCINIKVETSSSTSIGRHELKFTVEDSGIGIAEDKLHQIFESFTQEDGSISRTYGGTGLGTTISKMFVELMGGDIRADSPNPNNTSNDSPGSVFTFTVNFGEAELTKDASGPLGANDSSEAVDSDASSEVDFNGIEILLAEDNIINQRVAQQLFSTLGCVLHIAKDGKEALEKVNSKTYDLIFMDQMMPIMDGISSTMQMRASGVKTPIIAMSANVLQEDRDACLEAGMNDSINKPVMRGALVRIIRKWNGNGCDVA